MAEKGFKRKLAAILSADVVEYSRLMEEDEEATVRTLTVYREVLCTLIQQHNGKVLDSPGDNLLAEFVSVVDAVQCAVAVQKEIKARNDELPENRRMQFRIGINLGDVIQEEDRIYGDGVNIAARLEALADPGGICVSKTAFDHIEAKLPLGYEFLGEQEVKNIAKPIGAYRVLMEPRVTVAKEKETAEAIPFWRRKAAIAGAIAVVVIVIGVALLWNFYLRPPPIEPASVEKMAYPLPEKPSVAVLPFVNMSDDPKQEFFSDGLTDQIIASLSKVHELFVIARNSTFTYKGKPVKVQQVAEELGVRYVLEGSVRKSGDNLRVTVQLIDALKGHHLWAEQYDREMKDVFAVQDDITIQILVALQVQLTSGPVGVKTKGTQNLQAYLKALEALSIYLQFTREGNVRARQLYEETIAMDPEYARAYAMLAIVHLTDLPMGLSKARRQSLETAIQYAEKAQSLDETDYVGNLALVGCYIGKRDFENAVKEGKKAIDLAPGAAGSYNSLARALCHSGRSHEAIEYFNRAIRIDPFPSPGYYLELGYAYFLTGNYEEAVRVSKKACALTPNNEGCHRTLAAAYGMLGKDTEARAEAAELLRIMPDWSIEGWKQRQAAGWKNQADVDHFAEGLSRAGLPERPPLPLPDKPSIAVLPFVNMSGDPEQEYFSDGITENIIMALSKTPKLFVIARNSTFAYKDKPFNIKQAAEELGVRYILEGSVQKTENRVRITAQLIDAATGRHQWAERYDRELKDIFALQDEITLEIITALQVELTEGEQSRIHRGGTTNLEAFLKILKGREHHFRFTKEDVEIAKEMYKEAIALDPRYAAAYYWLAGAICSELDWGWTKSREKDIQRLFELSEKILALDDSSAQAHLILSRFYFFTGQLDRAITQAEKAVDLDPNDADGYSTVGVALNQTKRYKEAIPWFKEAIRRNPSPPIWYLSSLGISYLGTGNHEEAIPLFKAVINTAPTAGHHAWLGYTLSMAGKHEEALGIVKKAINFRPKESHYNENMLLSFLAEYYRRTGRYEEAIDTGRKLLDSNPNNKDTLRAYITMTCAYSALGKTEDADAAAMKVLQIVPDFSVEALTTKDSFVGLSFYDWFLKHEPDRNLLVTALRKAGLK
jgi:pentatricopeptide repeat protein